MTVDELHRPTTTDPSPSSVERPARRRTPRRYVVLAVLAVLAVLGALIGPAAYSSLTDNGTAKSRIAADPPPTLFPDATVARVHELTDPQSARAAQLMQAWWKAHGTATDDAGFVRFAEATLPGPPTPAARNAEMAEIKRLDAQRTGGGVQAANWLEAHGKKDVWKLAAHDQAELLSSSVGDQRKNAVDAMLKMSKTIADTLGTTFQVSAPYVIDPALRPDHHVPAGATCPCSYPSRHASAAASSRTFLGALDPERDTDYRHWQDQIDYSRLYMAGHVPSDIAGGTLLGDMIGDYFLVTRAHLDPQALSPGA